MFRLITIEREYGCGGGAIAAQLANHLGWTLWDRRLTEEIARLANVDTSAVKRCDERMDGRFYRLAKTFWRGSYERSAHLTGQTFDTDCMMAMMEEITGKIRWWSGGEPLIFCATKQMPSTFSFTPLALKSCTAWWRMELRNQKRKVSSILSIASELPT
jgi:hypothetical protein